MAEGIDQAEGGPRRRSVAAVIGVLATAGTFAIAGVVHSAGPSPASPPLPLKLSETGLYVAGSTSTVRPEHLSFTPQYPLWSDDTSKRRWLHLPPGTSIDAARPDAWEFPVGTRLWKEFSTGRQVETRLIERIADGSWRYATYVWNADRSDALLAPPAGIAALPVGDAPGGRYAIPAEADCRACHEGPAVPALGVTALQLSPDRDPLAPRAERRRAADVDLNELVARGLLRNLPRRLLDEPPRIAAASPVERAALGYLHANCGHCHGEDADGGASLPVGLQLHQRVMADASLPDRVRGSMIGVTTRIRGRRDAARAWLVKPGSSEQSFLVQRMRSRDPRIQMPPLGTVVPDDEALALVERWIDVDLNPSKETTR
jgi:hypothetical protein